MKKKRLLSFYLLILIIFIVSCSAKPIPLTSMTAVAMPQASKTTEFTPLAKDTATVSPRQQVDQTDSPNTPSPSPTIYLPLINSGSAYYVAPNGSPTGDGSQNKPWDINTGIGEDTKVEPGSTVWLRGGKYGKGGATIINSMVVGKPGQPITIRAYPGEHVVIDGTIMVYGAWTTIWGLEVMNSYPNRSTNQAGSGPDDIARSVGINALAPNTKFINNIVHDESEGFGFWSQAVDSELYGNIIYNNGWKGPDRGHGYSIYGQNQVGTKLIQDNITFNNFGEYGVHIYGEGVELIGFIFDGNVNFNGKFLIGGLKPAGDITLTNNYFYRSQQILGYSSKNNQKMTLKNNYFGAQGTNTLEIKWWKTLDVSGNRIWNDTTKIVSVTYPDNLGTYTWNNNQYFAPGVNAFVLNNQSINWDQWKNQTGFDINSSFTSGSSSGVDVFLRPNKYEPNRTNIIIYNWDKQNSVLVDISGAGLKNGQKFVLHNTQNYFNEVIEGTYDGNPISIPMTGWSIAVPIGWDKPLQPTTFPQFGVFVLEGK